MRNRAVSTMKANARHRGIPWLLSEPEVNDLMIRSCFYCGLPPSNLSAGRSCNGTFTYSGIDRVDTAGAYEDGNVVPCCFACNSAKSTMSREHFLAWVERVFIHSIQGN